MSSLQKSMLKSKLPPTGLKLGFTSGGCRSRALQRKRDYEPVQWSTYFSDSKKIKIGDNSFHIYTQGEDGPLLVLLHGGGYSALTWAEFTKSIIGMVVCRILAIDLRGHGNTQTTDDENLSAETLAHDVAAVIHEYDDNAPIVLIGHSMGGAVAVRAAPLLTNLAGVTVIDVVEGTAMDALASMQSFLRSRPKGFDSIPQAIEWCVRSGQIRNVQSAKVSVPGQITNMVSGMLATDDIDAVLTSTHPESSVNLTVQRGDTIQEEETLTMPTPEILNSLLEKKYKWRIDLAKTEEHWVGWFKGLSAAFLSIPAPKMLLLAGIDRLDKELTVGQMQGKFQMQVLPACGHAVHEDVPDKVAEAIATFMVRHKFAEPASDFPRTFPAC
ncbi:protein phosphatase methylesterase 1 [Leptopilina boulardi]|uniref:protein phosphatase methylesterase 1 n=1 Tax=Leptopilina boulardi TaxID=63433 RepID=UPI0021F54D48|nr:protein phosphatase methylesterase 1 [Leptopilina boulardi]